jgi:hypothetical protein
VFSSGYYPGPVDLMFMSSASFLWGNFPPNFFVDLCILFMSGTNPVLGRFV